MSVFYANSKTVAEGWATITSAGTNTVVSNSTTRANGTNKADTIKTSWIDRSTREIYSNGGNDFIDISGNYGISWSKATVKSDSGNDSIRIYADVDGIHPSTVDIDSGVGNDFVSIYGGNNGFHGGTTGLTAEQKTSVSLNLGDGDDKLFIHGLQEKGIDISKVKITGGKGKDLISIYGGSSGIGGWANYGNATVSIDGGSGADTISINSIDNYGDVTITAGAGDVVNVDSGSADYFFDSTKKVTINGAVFTAKSKNTSAKIITDSSSITLNSDWNGTIKLQQGQKLTDNSGNVFDTSGTYSIVSGRNVSPQVIRLTENNDTYNNTSGNKIIYALNGDDSIYNSGIDVSILTGSGNDTVYNQGYNIKIDMGKGNDSVLTDVSPSYGSDNYKNATVFGGDGVDTLQVRDHQTSLNGGAGNDLISVYSSSWENNTLQGGKGNDIIYGGGSNIFVYANGDGNDTIYYAQSDDTIQIATNDGYTSIKSGNDLIIKVGSGKMTFKDGVDISLNIVTEHFGDNSGNIIIGALRNLFNSMNSDEFINLLTLIKSAANSVGENLNSDEANLVKSSIQYITDLQEKFRNQKTGTAGVADLLAVASSSTEEFANIYAILDKYSTGSNTALWGDAAERNIKVLTLAAHILGVTSSFVESKANVKEGDLRQAIYDGVEGLRGLGDVAEDIYKMVNKSKSKSTWNAMKIFVSLWNGALNIFEQSMRSHQRYYADGKWNLEDTSRFLCDVSLAGLYGIGHHLSAEADDVLLDWILGGYLKDSDLTYSERLSSRLSDIAENIGNAIAKFGANVASALSNMKKQIDSFIGSALINTTVNIGNVIANLLSGAFDKKVIYLSESGDIIYSSKNAVASISIGKTKFTCKALKNTDQNLSLGSKKDTSDWVITTKNGNDKIKLISNKNATIKSGSGNDTVSSTGKGNLYVKAGKGNDSIVGNAGNDKLYGDDGADTLSGGKGNDTMTGGKGKDVFVYAKGDGNDTITDYTAGQDKIKISSGSISKTKVSGKDVIFTVGTGSITVKNGKGKKITVV